MAHRYVEQSSAYQAKYGRKRGLQNFSIEYVKTRMINHKTHFGIFKGTFISYMCVSVTVSSEKISFIILINFIQVVNRLNEQH